MILKEFNLEEHIKSEKAHSFAEGHREGHIEGQESERKRFAQLTQCLIDDSRNEDIAKAAIDSEFCLKLYQEYHIV